MFRAVQQLVAISGCLAAIACLPGCGGPQRELADGGAPPTPEYRLKPVANRSFGTCSPAKVKSAIAGYERPEMMALGGSVFNGVSSMQINWWLADWSPPAQVARALRNVPNGPIPGFSLADYPDYNAPPYGNNAQGTPTFRLGLDLETTNIGGLDDAVRRQSVVMQSFESHRGKARFHDNLAFGGAAIDDILYGTPADYRARLDAMSRSRGSTFRALRDAAAKANDLLAAGKAAGPLISIFYAENSSFVLDPQHHKCVSHMTALDQVLLRQPKRLLVGVGSNSGLFTFLVSGQPIDERCRDTSFTFGGEVSEWTRYVSIVQSARDEFLANMEKLLNKLTEEGHGIGTVYVLGQLRPSSIANLKPVHEPTYPGLGRYYKAYVLDFSPGGSRTISGDAVRRADQLNSEVNRELKAMVEARNTVSRTRFVFVDLEVISDELDFKHTGDARNRVEVRDPALKRPVYIDNRVLKFSRREELLVDGTAAGQHIEEGGLFSIDNLHPTVVGYSKLANAMLDAIQQEEKVEFAPGAREIVSPQAMYLRYSEVDGNVLRRRDASIASRENWLQFVLDMQATVLGTRRLDCREPRRLGDPR